MLKASVYDLTTAVPHVPPHVVIAPADWRVFHQGYYWALVMALKVLDAAEVRWSLVQRTRRLEAKRKREDARREQSDGE
jgi:hypothetical protein